MSVSVDVTVRETEPAVAAGPAGRGAPLSAILAELDPAMLCRVGEIGPDPVLRDLVLWDPMDQLRDSSGGILLLIGVAPAERHVAQTVRTAAGLGYGAIVLKRRGADIGDLAALAAQAGVALLVAPDEVSWGSVQSMLAAALSAHGCDYGPVGTVGFEGAAADLFAVANTAATLADAAVTIEDAGRRVLAYSSVPGQPIDLSRQNTILGRHVPYLPYYNSEYDQVARASAAVFFPADTETLPRVVMPVRVGGRLIGSIWAIDHSGDRGAVIAGQLAQVAPTVALHLLRAAERGDSERQRRSSLLAAELAGDGTQASIAMKNRMPAILIAFGPLRDAEAVVDTRRLVALVTLTIESVYPDACCARVGDAVFVLLPGSSRHSDARIEQLMSSVIRAVAAELRIEVGGAYATRIESQSALRSVRADMGTALRAAAAGERRSGIVNVARDRHLVILQALAESGLSAPDQLLPQVAAVLAWDREHKTEYARTLLVHLDCFGDVRVAAQRLVVHVNSHRYRMRRLVQQFGIDLDNPELRLVVWLQLRIAVGSSVAGGAL